MMFRGAKWTTDAILSKIGTRRIKSLTLYDTQADDNLLLSLASVGSLVTLDMSSEFISDTGVQAIVRQCRLQSLMFRDAPAVTDKSMSDISTCKTLKELYLDGTSITDDGIAFVSQLPGLWSLSISRTRVTDLGVRQVASDHIGLVNFDECNITGVGFSTWSVRDKMSFYTKGSSLNDEGFSVACKALKCMWNIIIEDTNVTNEGLLALKGQSTTQIRVNGSKINRDGVIWLIENTDIQGIETDSTQFSKTDAERFKNFNGRYLHILVH